MKSRHGRSWSLLRSVQARRRVVSTKKIKKIFKKFKRTHKNPKGITTNVQLQQLRKRMRIPYFKCIFMRTTLPTGGVYWNESDIINLDNAEGPGTHWVSYAKRGDRAVYFDSFGNLRPLKELVRYLNVTQIEYNRTPYQHYDQSNCGQLCLQFLRMADDQFKNWHCCFNSVFIQTCHWCLCWSVSIASSRPAIFWP